MLAIIPKVKERVQHACSLLERALAVSVSVVSFGFTGAKLRLLYLHAKQFWKNLLLKIVNKQIRRFSRAPGGVCATWRKYAQNIVFYICVRTRACASVKNTRKKILKKVV